MREARLSLAAGLVLIALGLVAVLSRAPASVAHANGIAAADPLARLTDGGRLCQAGESLPDGTSTIVLSLSAFHGPRVTLEAFVPGGGGRALTRGEQGSNWTGRTVTVPVHPVSGLVHDATVCVAFSTRHEPVSPFGQPTTPALAASDRGAPLPGRMRIEYLRPGERSWWSYVASIVRHMGFGRARTGTWVAFVAIAAMLAAVATAAGALVRELR